MTDTNILIVDDEVNFAMSLELILKRHGHKVAGIAPTGQEALDKFSETSPDIILLDVGLKGPMNGLELALKIRESSQVPIMFITGYIDPEIEKSLKRVSHSICLNKPIDSDELVTAISDLGTPA